jgi:ankyrin repeat protein
MFASLNEHVEVVAELLQHGARVDIQQKNGGSPLMCASQNGRVQLVAELLKHEARVDMKDEV